jgi:hypothetical protein
VEQTGQHIGVVAHPEWHGRDATSGPHPRLYDWRHPLAGLSAVLLMEFGDFAMLRRMLRGIKARAEPPPQVVRMLDHGRCHRTEVSDVCDDRPSMLSRDQGLRAASRKPIT